MSFERTLARLEYELDVDGFTRGAQLAVERGGRRLLDVAMGEAGTGARMERDTVFRVYCTIKPFTAIVVAGLVAEGRLDLDARIEPWLPDIGALSNGVTLRHLLTHTAGVHRLRGVDLEFVPFARRRAAVASYRRPPGWRIGIDAGYSETMAWHLLGWLAEAVAAEPLQTQLRTRVIEPLGLSSTWIGMTDDDYTAAFPRLGVNYDLRHLSCFPLLYERTRRVCTEVNPAHGGYTTAGDLARFYSALLDRLAGRGSDALPPPEVLRACTTPARPPTHDEVLDRTCTFGLGFMTGLADHRFGRDCSPASFGHSGYVGSSFAFADPQHGLSVAVIFNGVVGHDSAFLRREALVRALYADVLADQTIAGEDPAT